MIQNKKIYTKDEQLHAPLKTYSQWMARIWHAIDMRRRDRDVERLASKLVPHNKAALDYNAADIMLRYALAFNQRIPAFEPILMHFPYEARDYATQIIKGRWIDAEPTILSSTARGTYIMKLGNLGIDVSDIPKK